MKKIEKTGVVGAGTMGAALAQKYAMEGFSVVLVDRTLEAAQKGLAKIQASMAEGVEKKVFSPKKAEETLARITASGSLADLMDCDLVTEAIFEDLVAKVALFGELGKVCRPDCLVATNTSSFKVSDLASGYPHSGSFLGLHYFYHAAKNRLVEIIPGKETSPETLELARLFCFQTGKDAIFSKDSKGFIVNRFFVPWLNEAARLLEDGTGTIAEVDQVCREVFGIGMGPFALMNATGVPVAYHSQKTLEAFGPSYAASERLRIQTEAGKDWELPEESPVSPEIAAKIKDRMLGAVLLPVCQLLDEQVCAPYDLDHGAKIGLKWKRGPVELMKKLGGVEVARLVKAVCDTYGDKLPKAIDPAFWTSETVHLSIKNGVGCIRIDMPEDLNALNEAVVADLEQKFTLAEQDASVRSIILTGSGKAFVAGADVKFFVRNIQQNSIDTIEAFTQKGQDLFARIDGCAKPVTILLNGLALGGGLELALCADTILALPHSVMAFPETGIGIYPGLGGTVRSARRVGKALAKYLIFTGNFLSAKDAKEIGLVDGIISPEEMFALMNGEMPVPVRQNGASLPEKWEKLSALFNQTDLTRLVQGQFPEGVVDAETQAGLQKRISTKAPIAMRISESLINQAEDPKEELKFLREIFSTQDALLGLSSIGKKVEFSGN